MYNKITSAHSVRDVRSDGSPFNRVFTGKPLIHRFFDSSPLSEDDRFIAVTEFETDEVTPKFLDAANLLVVDLTSGKCVFSFKIFAWDSQVGCHAQWGYGNKVYFNDYDKKEKKVIGYSYDPYTETLERLSESIYIVGRLKPFSYTPYIPHLSAVQLGYGIRQDVDDTLIPLSKGASNTVGITRLSLINLDVDLLLTVSDITRQCEIERFLGDLNQFFFFIFHVKLSPCENKLLFILRAKRTLHTKSTLNFLIEYQLTQKTFRTLVTPAQWGSGHHPNYFFDSSNIVMNLPSYSNNMINKICKKIDNALVRFSNFKGFSLYKLKFGIIDSSGSISFVRQSIGSGHPVVLPGGKLIVTDCYPYEPVAISNDEVPIRLIDIISGTERILFTLDTQPNFSGKDKEWRIDPHPALSLSGKFLIMNAKLDGVRSVLVCRIEGLLK